MLLPLLSQIGFIWLPLIRMAACLARIYLRVRKAFIRASIPELHGALLPAPIRKVIQTYYLAAYMATAQAVRAIMTFVSRLRQIMRIVFSWEGSTFGTLQTEEALGIKLLIGKPFGPIPPSPMCTQITTALPLTTTPWWSRMTVAFSQQMMVRHLPISPPVLLMVKSTAWDLLKTHSVLHHGASRITPHNYKLIIALQHSRVVVMALKRRFGDALAITTMSTTV